MVNVKLDCKIEMPDNINQRIIDSITKEINEKLDRLSQELSEDVVKIIHRRSIKIYQEA
jgi:hypothetical protein